MAGKNSRKPDIDNVALLRRELAEAKRLGQEAGLERDLLRRALDELGVGVVLSRKGKPSWIASDDRMTSLTGRDVTAASSKKTGGKEARSRGSKQDLSGILRETSRARKSRIQRVEVGGGPDETRTVEIRSIPLKQNGESAVLNVLVDVTDKARIDLKLRKHEEWEEGLFENAIDGLFILDMEQNIVRMNRGTYIRQHIDRKRSVGRSWFELVPDELASSVKDFFALLKSKGFAGSFATCIIDSQGRRVEVEMCGFLVNSPIDNTPQILVRLHDVSDAFRQHERLHKLAAVIEHSPIPIAEFDSKGKVAYVNTAFQKLIGLVGRMPYGKGMDALFSKPSYGEVKNELMRSLASKGQWLGEVILRKGDGGELPSEMRVSSVSGGGNGAACVAFITDITERKRTEAALVQHADTLQRLVHAKTYELHETEDRYRTFLENLEDIAYEVDTDGRILYVNEAAAKISGLAVDQIVGLSIDEFFVEESLGAARESLGKVLEGRSYEAELTFWNGITCHFKSSPLRNSLGEVVGAFGTARDITERRRADDELRKSEEKLRQVIQHMPVMMNAYDESRTFVAWNGECERLTGYSADEIIGNPRAMEMLYPDRDDRRRIKKAFDVRGGDFRSLEWTIACKDGSRRTMLSYNISKLFPIPGWYSWAVAVDITERKKSEEALRESERKYRTTIDAMTDLIHVVDSELRIILANHSLKSMCDELGLDSHLDGAKVADVFTFLPANVFKEYRQVLSSKLPLMTEETSTIGGREIITETRKIPIFDGDKVTRILTVVHDITDLRNAERDLEHRIELERLLTHISTQFINLPPGELDGAMRSALGAMGEYVGADRAFVYMLSAGGGTMECTHAWRGRGVHSHKGSGSDIPVANIAWTVGRLSKLEVIHVPGVDSLPDDAGQEARRFRRLGIKSTIAVPLVFEGSLKGFFSLDSLRKEKQWTEEDTAILRNVAAIFVNALERKRSDEKLRQSEALERALLNSSEDPMILMELDGTVIAANDITARHVGMTREELASQNILQKFPPKTRRFRKRMIQEVVKTGKRVRFEDDMGTRLYDTTVDPILDGDGNLARLALAARDITELKRLQDQVQVSAKLASLGVFVAGIAHEINNPLASIKVDIHRLAKKAALRKDCDKIIATIGRISAIVDNLLKYARGQGAVLKPNKVEKIIESALEIVRDRFRAERKEISVRDGSGDSRVFCDFGKLQQVFLNLAVNSCDAMKRGGKLAITTRYDKDRNEVVVVFRDNGKGVAKEDIPRVFDPFFTTKSEGTGLGLSISHRIIQDHNGTVALHSERGEGTEVIIRLPAEK